MKKLFSLIITLFLMLSFVMCSEDTTQLNTQNTTEDTTTTIDDPVTTTEPLTTISKDSSYLQVESDLDSIELSIPLDSPLITLPLWSNNGTFFYWDSNNPEVITDQGVVIRPPAGSDSVDVTLTCTGNKEGTIVTKDFFFTVLPNSNVTVTSSRLLPFDSYTDLFAVTDKPAIELFYVDDGNLPYIDIETYIDMIDGALHADWITYTEIGDDQLKLTYQAPILEYMETVEIFEENWALFDFTENTLTVSSFYFFYGIQEWELNSFEEFTLYRENHEEGQELVIDLGAFNFDIVMDEGNYLVPLDIMNLYFSSYKYYEVYYNGDTIYGMLGDDIMQRTEKADEMRTSSYNTETVPDDIRLAAYHFMALTLTYSYGLHDFKGITNSYEILSGYAKRIFVGTDTEFYNELAKVVGSLDELHSVPHGRGYYEQPYNYTITSVPFGAEVNDYYAKYTAMSNKLIEKFGEVIPEERYLDSGKKAIFYFTGFGADTHIDFYNFLSDLPAGVEDVVIDLSFNTGGNVDTAIDMLKYMTDELIPFHFICPADGSETTYMIETDAVSFDYNYYILVSNISFSCANLFPIVCRDLGIPIIGQHTGGGSCWLDVIIVPGGFVTSFSSNNTIAYRTGNQTDGYTYVNSQAGIDPDYFMSDVTDDAELLSIIASIKAQ